MLESILLTIATAATPLLLAAIGELVVERSGTLNLGVEGMMVMGAVGGFVGMIVTGNPFIGALVGVLFGAGLSLLFAFLALTLATNQYATGLALTILGLGLSGLIGEPYVGRSAVRMPVLDIPGLSDIPIIGRLLFGQDPIFYISIALVIAVAWFLFRTKQGLTLRSIGDNPQSAHALGINVIGYRYLAVLFGGPWLDCAGACGLCLLAPGPSAGRRLSVRRGFHRPVARPGAGDRHSVPVPLGAPLSRHRPCSGLDFPEPAADADQHPGLARQELRAGSLNNLRKGQS